MGRKYKTRERKTEVEEKDDQKERFNERGKEMIKRIRMIMTVQKRYEKGENIQRKRKKRRKI